MILAHSNSSFWPVVSAVVYGFNLIIAIYASISMILRRQDPVKTLAWTAVLLLLPYIGILFYFLFGQNFRKRKIFSRKGLGDLSIRKNLASQESEDIGRYPEILSSEIDSYKKLIIQNLKNSYSLIDYNNDIEFYFNGKDALDAMYEAIENATHHIHLQTYIIEQDRVGERFISLLKQKASNGVEVRLIYDGVGSIHLKKKFVAQLSSCGIEMLEFSPVKFLMPMSKVNYRNHRKILVIDGKVGFLGGVNLADRYYYGNDSGPWYDTQVKVVGESVFSLQASFMLDRYFILNHKLSFNKKYYPHIEITKSESSEEGNHFYGQIISSGPDSDWAGIMQCYFTAINIAKEHIYISTPYFTPNETILNALKAAALGGIDVKIMIPLKGDSQAAHYSTRSYITELLEAGVEFYLFRPGFNHSKVISIDGNMCVIGSANMDSRSFEHNFEIMFAIYDSNSALTFENEFDANLAECDKVTLSEWKKRAKSEKIKESFYRLLSPLI